MIHSCIPVIPSADIEKSLHFWVDALGLIADQHMHEDGKLIGCMVHNDHVYFWLNRRGSTTTQPEGHESIRLYWAPDDIHATRNRLAEMGFTVSSIEERAYGQTEFFATDEDGHSHTFGVATKK